MSGNHHQKVIDLRSDTVTKPSPAMLDAMMQAEVGDDVMGEDPTVHALEALAAEMLGHEAAIFAPSGTQTNLLAIMSHCQRGDEYIVGSAAHTYRWEGGGAAVLGSVQPQPLPFQPDGTLDLDQVRAHIKPDDVHFARTRLLCLENSQAGKVLPLPYIQAARRLCDEHGLAFHLDGARVFNAAVGSGVAASTIASEFDSVSVCLSKGLGAPVGSVLAGSKELIYRARRWRKTLGGGMRQAGYLAAAGMYALQNNVDRLAIDHQNAQRLAEGLKQIDSPLLEVTSVATNMVFCVVDDKAAGELREFARQQNIMLPQGNSLRLVTHMDVSSEDMDKVVEAFQELFSRGA